MYWELFRDTGDPVAWLMTRRAQDAVGKIPAEEGRPDGQAPVPGD